MLTSYKLALPALEFDADGIPRSNAFDDVYFDKDAGLEETRYVFLEHNRLAQRFQALAPKARFTIAETGFGTGLNCLCAMQLFCHSAPKDAWLHFVSVEKFPLSQASLAEALQMWPSLAPFAQALVKHYPTRCYGLHRIELPEFRTTLTLWFGEASEGLSSLTGAVDAWFLDGFAPSKNPEMWSTDLFQHIQRLSHAQTTFATFTAAGIVRRGLQAHGFTVEKVKGFGHKREMMIGQRACEYADASPVAPWFDTQATEPAEKVLVVGSGIAGATTAYALAQKGISVEVWEQEQTIANGASGNEQGMLYPKLGASDTPVNRFYLAAYLHAHRFYQDLAQQHPEQRLWSHCGLLQRPKTTTEQTKFEKIIASELYPEEVLKMAPNQSGLSLPLSGWARPNAICTTLLQHPNIHLKLGYPLTRLESIKSGHVLAYTQDQPHRFSHIVLCTANQQEALSTIQELPTKAIRGQVTQIDVEALPTSEHQAIVNAMEQVLCADGYVSPVLDQQLNFGATYDLHDTQLDTREQSHKENLNKLERLLDIDLSQMDVSLCRGRSALRCTVTDYTPIVGPISTTHALTQQFAPLRNNAKWQSAEKAEFVEGVWVNLGHGSRGLVSAPLSANYLASLLVGEPAPLERNIIEALHPNRFVIRKMKRGEA